MKLSSKASGFILRLFLFKPIIISITLLLCLFIITSCVNTPSKSSPTPKKQFIADMQWATPEWIELTPPISYYSYQATDSTEPLIYHLVRVQLNDPSISINATKPNNTDSYKTIGKRTEDYVKQSGAFIGINASPFTYPASMFSRKRDIVGLYIHKGVIASKAKSEYAALCFDKDKRAFIVNSQAQSDTDTAWFAFGGFWTILQQDTIYQFKNVQESRTAVGISDDGYTLYILTVEKNNKSTGLSFMNCAQILQQAGAKTAMQLDGGGSTSLVFKDYPQYSLLSSRKVANNLGIFWHPEM